ncbi:hypothetical protein BRADI_5g05212v3 [Brachypodium distachyon]|uniref:Uncharacterized protein n=1 Tax=Brachypodium distachyon TaxID=15368 RepID=A0A0Q3KQ47_BRADI|nr:hypothetical protein BRADI_5g05212v3 [Brachypodium distachyon]
MWPAGLLLLLHTIKQARVPLWPCRCQRSWPAGCPTRHGAGRQHGRLVGPRAPSIPRLHLLPRAPAGLGRRAWTRCRRSGRWRAWRGRGSRRRPPRCCAGRRRPAPARRLHAHRLRTLLLSSISFSQSLQMKPRMEVKAAWLGMEVGERTVVLLPRNGYRITCVCVAYMA